MGGLGKRFLLLGTINGMNAGFLYLKYQLQNGEVVNDSAIVLQNRFQFTGSLEIPTKAVITSLRPGTGSMSAANFRFIYLEPAVMRVTIKKDRFSELKLTGSKTEAENSVLLKMTNMVNKESAPLSKVYSKLNDEFIKIKKADGSEDSLRLLADSMSVLRKKLGSFSTKRLELSRQFYNRFPNSFVTVYGLRSEVNNFSYSELMSYYTIMDEVIKNSLIGKELKAEIDKLIKAIPGKKAPFFAALDFNGDSLKLTDFSGKYVLLDFWATWCVPCRAESSDLINFYTKYRGKGIEFVSVASDDRNVAGWKAAIKKDGTGLWKHILNGLLSEKVKGIGDLYSVSVLPTKFLIDPSGKIIGRYEGADGTKELFQALALLFTTN